jgi:hypothetical protein
MNATKRALDCIIVVPLVEHRLCDTARVGNPTYFNNFAPEV